MWKTEYSYVYPNNRGKRSKLYEPAVVVVVVGCVVVVVVAETTNRNKTLEDDRLTYMYSALHIVGLHALTDLHQVTCRNEHALA